MSELPKGWCWAKIDDTGEYINGYPFKPSDWSSDGKPIIRIQNLTNPGKPLNRTTAKPPESVYVNPGDLLVSWSATLDAFVWDREPAYLNQHIFKVVPSATLILPRLLYHWLRISIEHLTDSELLHGSTMKHINRGPFLAHRIPIPPRGEQSRLIDKLEELLSDLDVGLAELKAAQTKLGQYRQSLLKAAVDGSLTAEWRKTHTPTESGTQLLERILTERRNRWESKQLAKFQEQGKTPPKGWQDRYPQPLSPDTTNLPKLPEGWVWASLDMLGDIASGVAKGMKKAVSRSEREVAYLRVANVQRGYLDLTEVKTIMASEADIAELRLLPGDVLFNEGGDIDKLGRGWVWNGEVEQCIHQNHVFRFRPFVPELLPELISHHGNTFGQLWFKSAGKQTTNLASINMSILRTFPVPVAPHEEQRSINDLIGDLVRDVEVQSTTVQAGFYRAQAQRKNILKSAFSGKLVPQDPNDEPASVLLERIRAERSAQATKGAKQGRKAKT